MRWGSFSTGPATMQGVDGISGDVGASAFPCAHAGSVGGAVAETGDIDGAIAAYRSALQAAPNSVAAQNNLGVALLNKGQVDDALAAFRAASLQPMILSRTTTG